MSIDLKDFRVRLEDELTEIDGAIAAAKPGADTVVLDQSSVGRLSRMDAMQQQAVARGISERMVTRRRKLVAALGRIDAGTFGRCCECDADLDPERLLNDPGVVFCADCLAEREAG